MQKNRYTKEQMYALIRKWESGNISQLEFFKEQGISKSTFGYWRKKYLKEFGTRDKKQRFIPVNVSDAKSGENITSKLELVYPNGVRLVCSSEMDLSKLKPLIIL